LDDRLAGQGPKPLPAEGKSGQDANVVAGTLQKRSRRRLRWAAACVAAAALGPLPANAQEPFKGKTIRLVVATPPGGGYDTYGRLVARHLGASGMNATTWLHAQAPRDGTVIATFNKSQPFYQAIGQAGVRFRTEELGWIGSLSQAADHVSVWHTSGVKSIADAKMREVVMGADSGGTMTLYPALTNVTLGTRFKIVTGYPGSAAVAHAMEKGEVDGIGSTPWSSWKATRPGWIERKEIIALLQVGLKKESDLPDVPRLIDLAETDEHRALFGFVSKTAAIERPFAAPPGLAPELLAAYRRAFAEMARSARFRDEVKRLNLDLDPLPGEDVARIVAEVVTTPSAIVAKVKSITDEGR
jgi:tripartite-type tricarboxylate transporter receptor subunit TctC